MICIAPVGHRTLWVLAVGVAAALVSCSSDAPEADGPTATVPLATTTTDPYAVPEIIDAAYVNRVLAGLDQAVGEVVRLVVNTRTVPPEAIERLRALYVGEALQLQFTGFQRDIANGFVDYRSNPGNQKTLVTQLLTAQPSCIFAEVSIDFSAVGAQPNPSLSRQWIALVPFDSASGLQRLNPTQWMLSYEGFTEHISAPPNPCVVS